MDNDKPRKKLLEELSEREISPEVFYDFYITLQKTNEIPDIAEFKYGLRSNGFYSSIFDYLRSYDVLDGKGEINEEGLKLFDRKIHLEVILKRQEEFRRSDEGPRGGIMPCRRVQRNGGVAPCRN
jgi:hypothetical protein